MEAIDQAGICYIAVDRRNKSEECVVQDLLAGQVSAGFGKWNARHVAINGVAPAIDLPEFGLTPVLLSVFLKSLGQRHADGGSDLDSEFGSAADPERVALAEHRLQPDRH